MGIGLNVVRLRIGYIDIIIRSIEYHANLCGSSFQTGSA